MQGFQHVFGCQSNQIPTKADVVTAQNYMK